MVQRCKKLPCNHIFHTNCLRSWFQRQHTCPTCRLDILRTQRRATRQQQQQHRNVNNQQPVPGIYTSITSRHLFMFLFKAQPNPGMMFPPMMGWPPPMAPPMVPPPPAPVPPQQPQEAQAATPPTDSSEATSTNTQPTPAASNVPPPNLFPPQFGMGPPPFMTPPLAPPTMFGSQPGSNI